MKADIKKLKVISAERRASEAVADIKSKPSDKEKVVRSKVSLKEEKSAKQLAADRIKLEMVAAKREAAEKGLPFDTVTYLARRMIDTSDISFDAATQAVVESQPLPQHSPSTADVPQSAKCPTEFNVFGVRSDNVFALLPPQIPEEDLQKMKRMVDKINVSLGQQDLSEDDAGLLMITEMLISGRDIKEVDAAVDAAIQMAILDAAPESKHDQQNTMVNGQTSEVNASSTASVSYKPSIGPGTPAAFSSQDQESMLVKEADPVKVIIQQAKSKQEVDDALFAAALMREKTLTTAKHEMELAAAKHEMELAAAKHEMQLATAKRELELGYAKLEIQLAAAKAEMELAAARRDMELTAARREIELLSAKREIELVAAKHEAEMANARREIELATVKNEMLLTYSSSDNEGLISPKSVTGDSARGSDCRTPPNMFLVDRSVVGSKLYENSSPTSVTAPVNCVRPVPSM